ncbi:glycosyltransferase [Eremococcus coleocola]|uniref:glycosyltransferase n=1 Tax=Eremococcus coleocola TaxID=88132 RepID=UPI00040C5A3D|nr:glycosyltransferase [Eremococcus coleocola]
MNIGFFTDTYFPQISGVSTSISILKAELESQGHQVTIFTTTDPNAAEDPTIVRLPSVPFIAFSDRRVAYRGFDKCLKIAQEKQLDIIHTHTEFSLGLAGQFVASRLDLPLVHTYHTMYERYTHYIADGLLIGPGQVKVLTKQFCSLASGVIVPSQLTYNTLKSYGVKTHMRVIPTGIPLNKFNTCSDNGYNETLKIKQDLGLDQGQTVYVSLSRLSKEKSIDVVIQAFKEIYQEDPNSALVIVGDGPEKENLELLSRSLLNKAIFFLGEVSHDQVGTYYRLGDVYLNASDSETQGLTYIEALVNHVPVVAKENDYLKEVFTGQVNFGFLYQDVSEFKATALKLVNSLRTESLAPISDSQLYAISAEKFGATVEAFYQDILSDPKKYKNSLSHQVQNSMKRFIRELVLGSEQND